MIPRHRRVKDILHEDGTATSLSLPLPVPAQDARLWIEARRRFAVRRGLDLCRSSCEGRVDANANVGVVAVDVEANDSFCCSGSIDAVKEETEGGKSQ